MEANGHHYNGYSFRIGVATSASQAGVPETTIKILGQWSSMTYQQYITPVEPAAVSKLQAPNRTTNKQLTINWKQLHSRGSCT